MRDFVTSIRRAVMKPIAACALAAGLMLGGAGTANAANFQFSYTTATATVSGIVTATLAATPWGGAVWDITGVSGTRNGDAITGLWCGSPCSTGPYTLPYGDTDNYLSLAGYSTGPYANWNFMDLHFIAGGNQYIFAFVENYGAPLASEADVAAGGSANVDYGYTGRCTGAGCSAVRQYSLEYVPEINASASLSALSILLAALFIAREMFVRRRRAV